MSTLKFHCIVEGTTATASKKKKKKKEKKKKFAEKKPNENQCKTKLTSELENDIKKHENRFFI